ncbi:RNA-dependent ATPase rok1 [Ptychographa xylographoides]|nr:RNA-dependent ATPase rok1 [Ptychographa xylographoides]
MDILRLLSRSTSLQKSLPNAKKLSDQDVPSAGVPVHPQMYLEPVKQSTALANTYVFKDGNKRKRKSPNSENALEEIDTLNFFENHGHASKKQSSGPREAVSTVSQHKEDHDLDQRVPRLTKEECRKMSRTHKVKVTLLHQSSRASAKEQKHKKRSATSGESNSGGSKKEGYAQLSPQLLTSFSELRTKYRISRRLAANLDDQGYVMPTEVQMGSLPLLLGSDEDRDLPTSRKKHKDERAHIDLLTIAPTGSGKTLAFFIPLLHGLLHERHSSGGNEVDSSHHDGVSAIVVAPTHELVDQIVNEGKKLAIGTGLKVSGMQKGMQLHNERGESGGGGSNASNIVKADVLVTTPLVLLHALSNGEGATPQALPSVRYLVLDEADVLLDILFRSQTLALWKCCINEKLQTSLWSATIGSSIEELAQSTILQRRSELGLSASTHYLIRLIVGIKDSALPTISHRLVYAGTEQGKLLAIRQLLHPSTADASSSSPALRPPILIFTQTIPRAVALHSELLYDIAPESGGSTRIALLHSDLSDTARSNIMARFRKGEVWVLITTDLLSRGVDFRGINGIVNYDIPNTGAAYIHRAGRTGRAGREGGVAVTLYTKEDISYVKNIANVIAASQKAKGKAGEERGEGVQKWLLDALPNVSKKSKQKLKKRGVEARRATPQGADGRNARKMRISTKSGFDRRLENRRKGVLKGPQGRDLSSEDSEEIDIGDPEWSGIEE